MSENNAPPIIFDRTIKTLRRERAQRRKGRFIIQRIAQDAVDRIQEVNRTFETMLVTGHSGFKTDILSSLPTSKRPATLYTDLENCTPDSLDIALSLLELHSENDPVGHLIRIHEKLKPDGVLMAVMFGGETLARLKQAFYAFDQARFGGVTPRVFPSISHVQAGDLLRRAGYALPVIDKDVLRVHYSRLQTLISDLRDMGETNFLTTRKRDYLGRSIYKQLEDAYPKDADKSKFPTQFEFLWLSGRTPHESQQTPLKPGSAKIHLSEALKPKSESS